MKAPPPVLAVILIRVSTAKQVTARQVSGLQAVSGRADQDQRHWLNEVERLARARKIKKICVHEVSRLVRRNSIVHCFVEMLEEVGVSLYWHAMKPRRYGSGSIADWLRHGGKASSLACRKARAWMGRHYWRSTKTL